MEMVGFYKLVTCVTIGVGLMACSDTADMTNNEPVPIQLFAHIGKENPEIKAKTRASGTQWEAGDAVGAFMVGNGTTYLLADSNVLFVTEDGEGNFTTPSGGEIYFPVDNGQKVDFIAYYPYNTNLTGTWYYPVDVSGQNLDLLWTNTNETNTAGYSKEDKKASLVFEHRLTKFVISTVPGDGLDEHDLAGMRVTVRGMDAKATFDIETGTLRDTGTPADIEFTALHSGEQYQALLIPQVGKWEIAFELVNGEVYTWTPANPITLQAGKQHVFTICIQKMPVQLGGSTIHTWDSVPQTEGIAK